MGTGQDDNKLHHLTTSSPPSLAREGEEERSSSTSEKESRDLQLAARIGLSLLEENHNLRMRNEELEEELLASHDSLTQLRKDLSVKTSLLQIYSRDLEWQEQLDNEEVDRDDETTDISHRLESTSDLTDITNLSCSDAATIGSSVGHLSACSSRPTSRPSSSTKCPNSGSRRCISASGARRKSKFSSPFVDVGAGNVSIDYDLLQDKVSSLERDNRELREQTETLEKSLEQEERKEMQLIHDFLKQLSDSSAQMLSLQEDLGKWIDENLNQQKEINTLMNQMSGLQKANRELAGEAEGYRVAYEISQDCQKELATELLDLKEKYDVLLGAFHELQQELRRRNHFSFPGGWAPNVLPWSQLVDAESLAAELESTLASTEGGYFSDVGTPQFPSLNGQQKGQNEQGRHSLTNSPLPSTSKNGSYNVLPPPPKDSSRCNTPDSWMSSATEIDSLVGPSTASGIIRRGVHLSGNTVQNTQNSLSHRNRHQKLPSPSTKGATDHDKSSRRHQTFVKLKMLKPLEGSSFLHRWRQLATPHLGVILESSSGVQSKALKDLNADLLSYVMELRKKRKEENNNVSPEHMKHQIPIGHIDDQKESETTENPGKAFDSTSHTYTFTMSTTTMSSRSTGWSTESTVVTPSLSSFQVADGFQNGGIPISSTSFSANCLTTVGGSLRVGVSPTMAMTTTTSSSSSNQVTPKPPAVGFSLLTSSAFGLDGILSLFATTTTTVASTSITKMINPGVLLRPTAVVGGKQVAESIQPPTSTNISSHIPCRQMFNQQNQQGMVVGRITKTKTLRKGGLI